MDNKTSETIFKPQLIKAKPYTCKFTCPPIMFKRIQEYLKQRGIKESTLFLMSVDSFLSKNNF